jgi:hypothetical protein
LNQEDINHQNSFEIITNNEIDAVIKSFPSKESQGLDGFKPNFTKTLIKN